MTYYGHEVEFGLFPTPDARDLHGLIERVQLAEVAGLDLVSLQDHPYQARHGDMWTLLSVLAARTTTVRLAPNVASLPLRDPVVLAKAAATLDLISHGRVEIGLGAGAFWEAIEAAGGPRRTPGEAVDALVEAIDILRDFWAGGTAGGRSIDRVGRYYQVKGLRPGPAPTRQIPLWLGAYKPRMLRVTGRLADGWVPSMGYADPPALAEMNARIDEAALEAGRLPVDIRRIYNVFGEFGRGSGFLQGGAEQWAQDLAGLALDEGMSLFILGTDEPDVISRFAGEVAPRVRELVAEELALASTQPHAGGPVRVGGVAHEEWAAPGTAHEGWAAPPTATPPSTSPLLAVPTPDDGTRLSAEQPWDEAARPTHPVPDRPTYTSSQQAMPQHLVDIHDGLRAELSQLRDLVGQVRDGLTTVGAARSAINTMTMRQNNWTLGAYCESYCRIVTGHHSLEDAQMFPGLRRAEPALAPVIDRLEQEHHVIHDVLERVDRALVALVQADTYGGHGRAAIADLGAQVDLLSDTLLSHLSYEERELLHPLARHTG